LANTVTRKKKFAVGPWSQGGVIATLSSKSKHYYQIKWTTEGLNGEKCGTLSKRWYSYSQLKLDKFDSVPKNVGKENVSEGESGGEEDVNKNGLSSEAMVVGRLISVPAQWWPGRWIEEDHGEDKKDMWSVIIIITNILSQMIIIILPR
jgi:hypothetical protein